MANTLAYYDTATITAVKSFIVQAPGISFVIAALALGGTPNISSNGVVEIVKWLLVLYQSIRTVENSSQLSVAMLMKDAKYYLKISTMALHFGCTHEVLQILTLSRVKCSSKSFLKLFLSVGVDLSSMPKFQNQL